MDLGLSRAELTFIRAEFLPRFGTEPRIDEGILLRSWKAGPHRGEPRIPAALRSLIERELMVVRRDDGGSLSRAYFTSLGIEVLGEALRGGKSFSRDTHGHLFRQLELS